MVAGANTAAGSGPAAVRRRTAVREMADGTVVAFAGWDCDRSDVEVVAVFGRIGVVGSCCCNSAIGHAEVELDVAAGVGKLRRKARPWLVAAAAVAAAGAAEFERHPELALGIGVGFGDWADEPSATGRMSPHIDQTRPVAGKCQREVAL